MVRFRLSPVTYRRIVVFALVALGFIIVTGGAVRLTGSGLGCSDWPTCEDNRVVAPLEYHAMVEFVNRTITGLVSIAVILAVAGSLLRRPRRRDLLWWSLGLVAGVLGQIVLGGLTVLFHLWPPLVMGHFLLSMVLVWNAVLLWDRASAGPGPPRSLVGARLRSLGRWLVIAAAAVILSGTVVTGAGPHGGDEDVDRLPLAVEAVAQVHGVFVMGFLALVLVTVFVVRRDRAPVVVQQRATSLLFVVVLQGAVGYTQYFTGVPPLLAGLHILGSVLVWVFTLRLHLGLVERPVLEEPVGVRPAPATTRAREPALVRD
ncbi:COX15/CtaA family protein [soil metagenome]